MNIRKTCLVRFLAVLLLLSFLPALGCGAESAYRELKSGDRGEDVLALKDRLYELGYISSKNYGDDYNKNTVARIKELQKKNGLKATGIATPELQELVFSDECIAKSGKKASDLTQSHTPEAAGNSPAVFAMPSPAGKDAPQLDEDGFLDADEPYIYANRNTGEWTYVSRSIHVEIRQRVDKSVPHKWLEAALRYREPAWFGSMLSESTAEKPTKSGLQPAKPMTIAEKQQAVFAISDDFFGYRVWNSQKPGIIVRNGKIWSEKTRAADGKAWPPLDIIAQFEDGSMKTFVSDAHTAQEYLDMGVVSTYAFGPILVEDGRVSEDLNHWRTTDRAPRMAIGITADGTILAIDALGRRKDAVGVTTPWLAERMLELGAVEALNLDGGNTTSMIFMDDIINRPEDVNKKDIRTVSGLIGVREGSD
ncbi:MAG: phosphodiester glycosidase family protein [Clostridiales bacterium]|nr:phosphodiester glycosidase family protein [Clostridiales bacterium]